MSRSMSISLSIESPTLADRDELLQLYFLIYGKNYPLLYGSDPQAMAEMISSDEHKWLIVRDHDNGLIVGSIVFEMDLVNKVGKAAALVVHPEYRKAGIASKLVSCGDRLIAEDGCLNSIYTTTRTRSVGPQLVFLREHYLPLGIFPNAHKLKYRETTTLCAKFKRGVLGRRAPTAKIPEALVPLYEAVREQFPQIEIPPVADLPEKYVTNTADRGTTFECIFAPHFVLRRFKEFTNDSAARFYPFHLPNLLLTDTNGELEIFAYLNQSDGYCTLIACNRPAYTFEQSLPDILEEIKNLGGAYVEVLIEVDRHESLATLLRARFLPSAFYPAMREADGVTYDYVVMTRSTEPLDFRGMSIDQAFKPYVDQYVAVWKEMHLDALEVFDDYT